VNYVGVPAVAGDTGGTLRVTSVTAVKVQAAPRTNRVHPTGDATSKRGRPFVLVTGVPPAATAPWYGASRVCTLCSAKIIRRVQRTDGSAFLRVSHVAQCKAR